ncbi:hypothetical protein GGX14DRAFT_395883 [Mycena pura]|uniref:Uncharacterized protein n=1 Tax=Mycena pura TaxID=153505 RepID=A0AAD6YAA3_9AGAR|nr:hypothetical protein GGX14DRAFT_395883 [Mycena pura]
MPLFRNHDTMDINAQRVSCPEPVCNRTLPDPRKCQSGANHGKMYTACFNEAHGPRYKFWDIGVVPNGLPAPAQPPAAPAMPVARAQNSRCASCPRTGNAQCPSRLCKTCCRAQSDIFCRIHECALPPTLATAARLESAAPRRRRESIAFPAPRLRERELPHERIARQQEAAARLAALTPLPPSPTLSQEARDEALAVSLALGTSPPPSVTTADTRRVSLVSWVHHLEASTTVVQDVAGWAQTWPTIHLSDFTPFLTSHLQPHPDQYYDYFNFRLGQWVAIPQAYAFNVVTDEPLLLRRVDTIAGDQHDIILSFARFVDKFLYPVQLPGLNRKRRRATTPTSRTPTSRSLTKKTKRKRTFSSDDDLEVSEVTRAIKLEPLTPRRHHSRRRLFSPSPPPVASSSQLPFETRRASSSSPFPPASSLHRSIYPSSPSVASSSSSRLSTKTSLSSFPPTPSLYRTLSSSSSSLASLCSTGSSTNPITLFEEEKP